VQYIQASPEDRPPRAQTFSGVIPEDAKLLELQKTDLSSIIGIGAHLSKN